MVKLKNHYFGYALGGVLMKTIKLITLVCLFVVFSYLAYALSIGVSPGRINFNDLLRSGYAERTVRITTNYPGELMAHFVVSGEIADWLRFEPNSTYFNLSLDRPYLLKVIIVPPNDTRSGSYSGKISIVTDRVGAISGRAGGIVKAGVTLILNAIVTDTEVVECSAGGFDFKDIEIGYPLEISYVIKNEGNVRIKPKVSFDIWDQNQEKIVFSGDFTTPDVLPTIQKRFVKKIFNHNLGVGQYWATISVDECHGSSLLSFSVVEKGGIVDKGILEQVRSKVWAYVNEPIEIVATFKNMGPRTVSAKFKGSIKKGEKIVKVIETEDVDVASGEKIDLKSYFTPEEPGRYTVSGRVIYNRKLTFEKGSTINVNYPEEKENLRLALLFLYLLILITIVFLVRKILKARKR